MILTCEFDLHCRWYQDKSAVKFLLRQRSFSSKVIDRTQTDTYTHTT